MESLAISAAGFLGKKAADLIEQKLKELAAIEGNLKTLEEWPAIIDAMIQDVEASVTNDADVRNDAKKNLLRKLKHLAYDLEDVLDCCQTEALRKQRSRAYFRPVRDFFSSNNNQLVFKSRIGGMIKAVMENLNSILLQKPLLERSRQSTVRTSPSASKVVYPLDTVIGRETEKEKIVNMLIDDEGSSNDTILKVIAIVGMGGLGKTTLADHVFKDERVKAHFGKLNMYWKVIGSEFNPTEIMKSVLYKATSRQVDISEPESVREQLEEALSNKKFLLVLDDVWNENQLQWRQLRRSLRCGARGSKVLVTTRSQKVSSIMGSSIHQIQQLSREDCLSLFQQFAFGDHEAANQELMEIGGEIVKKCGGLPLAAISLGSMLHGKIKDYWSSVLNSEVWQFKDEDQKFLAVFKLSYDALPARSKKCFAFGSLFPKNSVMRRDELIQLWIANGFICSEGNFDAETDGNGIFDDLVWRSLFLSASSENCNDNGRRITECTMHDLMHDLARSVSDDEYYTPEDYEAKKDIQKRTYHMSIKFEDLSNTSQVIFKKSMCLRTLLMTSCDLYSTAWKQFQLIFSELKFLRVLNLQDNDIKEVPTSVGNLIHLRYLDLSNNEIEVLPCVGNLIHLRYLDLSSNSIKVLPDTITLLQNLQYLNLQENCNLQELPKKLRNMQSLQYLGFESCKLTHMPLELSQLINLRSLSCFIAGNKTGSCSITELEDLKLHGKMEISFSENYMNYSCGGRKILKNKDFNELSLSFNVSDTYDISMLDDLCPNTSLKKLRIFYYGSRQFPTWLMESQLPCLVEVILTKCWHCEHVPHFGNLQFLRKLVIIQMYDVKQLGAEFHGHGLIRGFPSLQELQLRSMTNLEEWSESDGVDELFPLLKTLEICDCPELKNMPRLPRIELLKLDDCSESLLSGVGRMTSLSHLRLCDMKGMTSLPTGCLRNLTSLMKLEIISCHELQFLPWDEIQLLTMVHSLTIEECDNLTSFPLEEVGQLSALRYLCFKNHNSNILQPEILVQILNSLHEFDIQICGKIVNLCGQLQHLHMLRQLRICGSHDLSSFGIPCKLTKLSICCCDELESLMTAAPSTSVLEDLDICDIPNRTTLPGWLQHLRSLCWLRITNCPQLGSLPRCLQDLRSLQFLTINGCDLQLERRCQRETGEDWPNISHVPRIHIYPKDEAQCCGLLDRFFKINPRRLRET